MLGQNKHSYVKQPYGKWWAAADGTLDATSLAARVLLLDWQLQVWVMQTRTGTQQCDVTAGRS
jgi:hypothetical protein